MAEIVKVRHISTDSLGSGVIDSIYFHRKNIIISVAWDVGKVTQHCVEELNFIGIEVSKE